MVFNSPINYSGKSGNLIIEEGDVEFFQIQQVFGDVHLELRRTDIPNSYEVSIRKSIGFLEKLYVLIMSPETYIEVQGSIAMGRLRSNP